MPRTRNKRKRGQSKEVQIGKPAASWMLTYSDITMQILIFFVLFLTLMTMRERRIVGMILPLVGGKGSIAKERRAEKIVPPIINEAQMLSVKQQILIYAKTKDIAEEIRLRLGERGLTISFAAKAMFRIGGAEILPEARVHLDKISKILKAIPNSIRIEGHTCNIPIHNEEFASNWELSVARATNITKHLVERTGFVPSRISAAGYGEYHPYAPNDTEEHRQRNRRVDVVVLWRRAQTFP